jgi:hypothetical protein
LLKTFEFDSEQGDDDPLLQLGGERPVLEHGLQPGGETDPAAQNSDRGLRGRLQVRVLGGRRLAEEEHAESREVLRRGG